MNKLLEKIYKVAHVHRDMHFVYSGGDHGKNYVDYRPLGQQPEYAVLIREAGMILLKNIVKHTRLNLQERITIVGPETLGAQMANQILYASVDDFEGLRPNRSLLQVRTFKKNKTGEFEWAQPAENAISRDTKVIWFDDILNAASTFEKTNMLVTAIGGKILAIGVIGNRSGKSAADLGVEHLEALETFNFDRYKPDNCPLCKNHVPIVRKPGHGYQFEQDHGDYEGGFVSL